MAVIRMEEEFATWTWNAVNGEKGSVKRRDDDGDPRVVTRVHALRETQTDGIRVIDMSFRTFERKGKRTSKTDTVVSRLFNSCPRHYRLALRVSGETGCKLTSRNLLTGHLLRAHHLFILLFSVER